MEDPLLAEQDTNFQRLNICLVWLDPHYATSVKGGIRKKQFVINEMTELSWDSQSFR